MAEDTQKPCGTVEILPPSKPRIGGSRKGSPNKITRTVREMVVEALDRSGRDLGGEDGTTYLQLMAITEPKAFLALVGRIVPVQLDATITQHEPVARIERVIVRPDPAAAHAPANVVPIKREA